MLKATLFGDSVELRYLLIASDSMKLTERETAHILGAQYGVVSRRQLLAAGMTRRQVGCRCETGEWIPMHRGVYRSIAFPRLPEQRLMAAVLAAGEAAVVSHASAAWVWALLVQPPERPSLSVPAQRRPKIRGVDLFRPNDLHPSRISHWRNFPCTDPLRTLVDLAGVASTQWVAAAVDKALSTNLVTVGAIESELDRRAGRGRRGVRPLRAMLAQRGMTGAPAPSALEAEALSLLARWKVPVSGREVRAGPDGRYRIDISLVPPVMVEVDGFAFHWSPEAKAYDESRRNQLRLSGVFLLVYTWRDIRFEAPRVAREVLAALARYARNGGHAKSGSTLVTVSPPGPAPP